MKSKPFGALFGLLALVAIMGVAPAFGQTSVDVSISAGAGSSASADCVTAKNCFDPGALNIAPGTTVTWTNNDKLSHTITSGIGPSDNATGNVFDSGLVKSGKTFQFTFPTAGTYNYYCSVHPWMTGQVIVAGSTPSTAVAPAVGNQSGIPLGPPYTAPSNSTTPTMTPTSNMTNATTTPATTGQNAPGNQSGIPLGAPYTAGNATVPEFGPVAGIVLAIAVLSVVVFATKTRIIPKF